MSDPLIRCWTAQAVDTGGFQPGDLALAVRTLDERVGRRNRVERVVAAAVILVFAAYAWILPTLATRVGSVMTVVATGIVLWQLRRRTEPFEDAEALTAPLVDCYRGRLVAQRDALRSVPLWYVGPFVPGFVVFTWGEAALLSASALAVTAALECAVLAAVVVANRRAARRLDEEIERVDRERAST